ncbi:hypothetical protein BCR32DRAFT_330010 [Anaeromyces robustus]|uniref:Homeobox domain-containing protein n=1 Tax=Anaeromyces robustus TaxID=1754192 RepID=A0A1Y1WJK5_9FUNG|nr:hypothetical protein BCR32DRAFT_330010 [Anaeromyces robustus]|eukprot:ORX73406.1 hypothetical protein BCR32DRAFT_330010 [Anaeromyces robustus]
MTTKDQKIEPFAYQTSTIPEVKSETKKDDESKETNKEGDEMKIQNIGRKRSRATPEQLAILEATFEKNTSPNSKLREVLAEKVHMSERSIQIWFQNRRAKVKNTQKRNQQQALQDQLFKSQFYFQYPGSVYSGYPAYGQTIYQPGMPPKIINRSKSIDATMFNQSLNPVPEGTIANPAIGRYGLAQGQGVVPVNGFGPRAGLGAQNISVVKQDFGMSTLIPSVEKNYFNFTNNALVIGTWRRIAIANDPDSLRCSFSLIDKQIRWLIKEQNIRFKVEFPFSTIGQILLEPLNNSPTLGKLSFTLIKVPTFWMETNGPTNPVWNLSGDFTENQQASKVFRHILEGDYNHLRIELATIIRSSSELQQLCRIVAPPPVAQSELLYQQQGAHFQRRQSCPADFLLNPNNQYINGGRRLSIPSSTNLITIPQNVVVPNVQTTIVQPQIIDPSTQIIQTATAAAATAAAPNPLAKPTTIGSNFVASQPLNQPAVIQKVQLTSPVQNNTVSAAAAAAALSIQKPTAAATAANGATPMSISSPVQNTKAVAATTATLPVQVPGQATATATINPLTLSDASVAAATATATATATNTNTNDILNTATKAGYIMDNLNIMNGSQLTTQSTDTTLNLITPETSDSTLVDNSLSTLGTTTIGSNITLQNPETFDLGLDENQLFLNLTEF